MTRVTRPIDLGAAAILAALLASGCGRRVDPPPSPIDEAMRASSGPTLQEGRRLFAGYCATCHGEEGRGDGQNASRLSPRPPDLSVVLRTRPAAEVRLVVEAGTAAAGRTPLCPPRARDVGPGGVEAILAYLRDLGERPGRDDSGTLDKRRNGAR